MQDSVRKKPLRLVLYDPQWAVVDLVRDFLSIEPGIEIVAATASLEGLPSGWEGTDALFFGLQGKGPADEDLHWLMSRLARDPIPTLLAAPHTIPAAEVVLRALEAGALDFVLKTGFRQSPDLLAGFGFDVARRLRALQFARVFAAAGSLARGPSHFHRATRIGPARNLIAITASAGGYSQLVRLLPALPLDEAGILLSVPFPSLYSLVLASHLERACGVQVREAIDHDRIDPGRVLLAPGGFNLEVFPGNSYHYVRLSQKPPSPRPNADALFDSIARHAARASVGILLSGSGMAGVAGLKAMRRAGALTLVESEASAPVFELPKAALEAGAADRLLTLDEILDALNHRFRPAAVAA